MRARLWGGAPGSVDAEHRHRFGGVAAEAHVPQVRFQRRFGVACGLPVGTGVAQGVVRASAQLGLEIAQAADATFQGASSSCVSSYKNGAWTVKKSGGGSATDLVFEMQLRVPDMGSLMVVR